MTLSVLGSYCPQWPCAARTIPIHCISCSSAALTVRLFSLARARSRFAPVLACALLASLAARWPPRLLLAPFVLPLPARVARRLACCSRFARQLACCSLRSPPRLPLASLAAGCWPLRLQLASLAPAGSTFTASLALPASPAPAFLARAPDPVRLSESLSGPEKGPPREGPARRHVRGEGVRDDLVGLEHWCALLHTKSCIPPSQCILKRLTCSSSLVSAAWALGVLVAAKVLPSLVNTA